MAYCLNAFIGRSEQIKEFAQHYQQAKVVELPEGISLIPMTESLFAEINQKGNNEPLKQFDYLEPGIERVESAVLAFLENKLVGYVEAEYFGGQGEQRGVLWQNQQRVYQPGSGKKAINDILRLVGVKAQAGLDEFDTVGLGRHRSTSNW